MVKREGGHEKEMKKIIKQMGSILCIIVIAFSLEACGAQEGNGVSVSSGDNEWDKMSDERDAQTTPEPAEVSAQTEIPLLTEKFASAKAGNELQFGTYEQDNNLSNGAEPIEWIVLANDGNKIFVVSKYVLDYQIMVPQGKHEVTWEECSARKWLNDDFYNTAFSEEEKNCILETKVHTPDTEDTWSGRSDQKFKTYGGNDTQDFIFLLSYEETKEYLRPLGILGAEPTIASGCSTLEETGYTWWSLRSAGTPYHWEDDYSVTSTGYAEGFRVCHASGDGAAYWAYDVVGNKYWYVCVTSGKVGDGMRPAMWIRIK